MQCRVAHASIRQASIVGTPEQHRVLSRAGVRNDPLLRLSHVTPSDRAPPTVPKDAVLVARRECRAATLGRTANSLNLELVPGRVAGAGAALEAALRGRIAVGSTLPELGPVPACRGKEWLADFGILRLCRIVRRQETIDRCGIVCTALQIVGPYRVAWVAKAGRKIVRGQAVIAVTFLATCKRKTYRDQAPSIGCAGSDDHCSSQSPQTPPPIAPHLLQQIVTSSPKLSPPPEQLHQGIEGSNIVQPPNQAKRAKAQ